MVLFLNQNQQILFKLSLLTFKQMMILLSQVLRRKNYPKFLLQVKFQTNLTYLQLSQPAFLSIQDPGQLLVHPSYRIPHLSCQVAVHQLPFKFFRIHNFLLNASIAGSTWSKYKSALNVFTAFASTLGFIPIWPLESGIIRQFTIYCLSSKKLAPASVESYLSALRFFHLLKGLKPPPLLQDDLVKLFLRGARNISLPSPSHQKRRAVTLPILLLLRKKITLSVWSNFLKTAFWALFSLAFFGSCRMGELVSISRTEFDSLSTLRLRDILDRSTSLLVHLKCPKSGKPGREFIDVFPFNHADLCPVLALRSHMSNFQAMNISPDLPIFLDDNGYLFTIDYVNQALKKLLESSFDFSIDSLSAHSFRAGIPSELQRSPELLSNQDVQGWGRWNSEAFQRYEKLGLYEKKNIFNKISEVLQSNLP